MASDLLRALAGTLTLRRALPPLKKVGLRETLYAVWFTVCVFGALHSTIVTVTGSIDR